MCVINVSDFIYMDEYGAITWIHVPHKIAPLKTVIEATYQMVIKQSLPS